MTKNILFYILPVIIFFFILALIMLKNLDEEKIVDESRTVYIKNTEKGFQLFRNGEPFYIRGASGNAQFSKLGNIGGNTIRIYDTLNLSNILNEAHAANLAVIVDIPLPIYNKKYCLYIEEDNNTILKHKIKDLVIKYRHHPALLMWNLGNEIDYPSIRFKRIIYNYFDESIYNEENKFLETFNELIDIIHQQDPNHPVSTAISGNDGRATNASIYFNSTKLDVIAYNVFGRLKDLGLLIEENTPLSGTQPYYISEWGSDGHWECEMTTWNVPIEPTSTKKAEQIIDRYEIIENIADGECLGSLIFFWGEKHERTHTWFNLFQGDSQSEIVNELENAWKKSNINPKPIGLKYMLVEDKGARDNIVFAPNEFITSEIIFYNWRRDSLRIIWEIYTEDWYQNKYSDIVRPRTKVNNAFKGFLNNKASFITPVIEGPYRIFAHVYDQYGNFATANTPFYVLKENE